MQQSDTYPTAATALHIVYVPYEYSDRFHATAMQFNRLGMMLSVVTHMMLLVNGDPKSFTRHMLNITDEEVAFLKLTSPAETIFVGVEQVEEFEETHQWW